MLKNTLVFRLVVAAIVLGGAAVLLVSFVGGHRLPRDKGSVPVPLDDSASTGRR